MPTITGSRVEGAEVVLTVEVRVPVSGLTETVGGKKRQKNKAAQLKVVGAALKAAAAKVKP
jgi:hypothetical protein